MLKRFIIFLSLLSPFYSTAQQIDIYTHWEARLENNQLVILDLSSPMYMGVTLFTELRDNRIRVDSFGYNRNFTAQFVDVDSNTIRWSGYMEPILQNMDPEYRQGVITVINKHRSEVPDKILFTGEIPELGLTEEGNIIFSRMVIKEADQTTYQYSTHYGGNLDFSHYEGENSGYSMGSKGVGMIFKPFKFNADFSGKTKDLLTEKINDLRKTNKIEPLIHDGELDEASEANLTNWIKDANKQHRLDIIPDFEGNLSDSGSAGNTKFEDFLPTHYPFACGNNTLMLHVMRVDIPNGRSFKKFLKKNHNEIIEAIFSELLTNSGEKQNMLNEGYASLGQTILLYEGTKDDFYINYQGKKISLTDKKKKYYFIGFSQTYSVDE